MMPGSWLKRPAVRMCCAVLVALLVLQPCLANVPPRKDSEIRQRLTEILSRPEFSAKPKTDLLLRLLEGLADVLGWLNDLRAANPPLYWTLIGGCLFLLVLLAGHIAWTLRRVFFVGARLPAAGETEEKRQRLSLAYWQEARTRAAQGEFTEAIRFLFLSLVYRFDESGRVLFQHSATNREYLTLFAERPQLQSELKVFVDTLDEHWYGQHPTDQQQYEHCLALYESVK